MEILKPQPEDAVLLTDLSLRSKALWGYDESFIEQCREELTVTEEAIEAEKNIMLMGKESSTVVGFVWIDCAASELDALFVDPKHVRKGCGEILLNEAVLIAKDRGLKKLKIHSDPNAAAFYERMGAVKVGEAPSGSIPGRMLPVYELSLQ